MTYFVYIVSNKSHRLYVGMTSDPHRRADEHRTGAFSSGFTAQSNFDRLVYFEPQPSYASAIARGKQIKGWTRAKKVALIQAKNPKWLDLRRDVLREVLA